VIWPPEKIEQLPDGSLRCRDCKIVAGLVEHPHDFNIHDCKLGMEMLAASQRPVPIATQSTTPASEPMKTDVNQYWKERFF
jgi:hypothetical protein